MKLFTLIFFLLSLPALAQYTNESEVAMINTGGNSQVQTNNLKTKNVYQLDFNKTTFGGHYTYGESNNGVSARNWDGNARYEREISQRLSLVAGEIVEGNRFIGIKTRYNSDVGAKYYYIKSDVKTFFTELAYRYTIEDRYSPAPNAYDNKARLYNEFGHKISETVQYNLWLEYSPNFTDRKDYLLNGEASITSILNSTFSLKLAYRGMYDNKPAFAGLKNYDYTTTTSLVAKF